MGKLNKTGNQRKINVNNMRCMHYAKMSRLLSMQEIKDLVIFAVTQDLGFSHIFGLICNFMTVPVRQFKHAKIKKNLFHVFECPAVTCNKKNIDNSPPPSTKKKKKKKTQKKIKKKKKQKQNKKKKTKLLT